MKRLLFSLSLIFVPLVIFFFDVSITEAAVTYHYDSCSGWAGSGYSCSGGVFTGTTGGLNMVADTDTENTPFLSAGTWYLNYETTSSQEIRFDDNSGAIFVTGNAVDEEYTSTGSVFLQFYIATALVGDISNLCITDTLTGCVVEPPAEETIATTTDIIFNSTLGNVVGQGQMYVWFGVIPFFLIPLLFRRYVF